MKSLSQVIEEDKESCLPPVICNNPHQKIEPENNSNSNAILIYRVLLNYQKTAARRFVCWRRVHCSQVYIDFDKIHFLVGERSKTDISIDVSNKQTVQPVPKYPIALMWFPDTLSVTIDQTPITVKLTLINVCERLLYIHCCGIWNDEIRLGAIWRCYPKTRFLKASGLSAGLYVSAEPRESSPIPEACAELQLAVAYKRDHVIAYFMVPMQVQFKNYVTPRTTEHSTEKLSNCS